MPTSYRVSGSPRPKPPPAPRVPSQVSVSSPSPRSPSGLRTSQRHIPPNRTPGPPLPGKVPGRVPPGALRLPPRGGSGGAPARRPPPGRPPRSQPRLLPRSSGQPSPAGSRRPLRYCRRPGATQRPQPRPLRPGAPPHVRGPGSAAISGTAAPGPRPAHFRPRRRAAGLRGAASPRQGGRAPLPVLRAGALREAAMVPRRHLGVSTEREPAAGAKGRGLRA